MRLPFTWEAETGLTALSFIMEKLILSLKNNSKKKCKTVLCLTYWRDISLPHIKPFFLLGKNFPNTSSRQPAHTPADSAHLSSWKNYCGQGLSTDRKTCKPRIRPTTTVHLRPSSHKVFKHLPSTCCLFHCCETPTVSPMQHTP